MRATRRTRVLLAGACTAATLALTATAPAQAAPYTPDALLTISTTTPLIGGTLTITLLNFESGELITITLTPFDEPIGFLRADKKGNASGPITLPKGVTSNHSLLATGHSSGRTASTDMVIRKLTNRLGGIVGGSTVGGGGLLGATSVNYSDAAATPGGDKAPAAAVAAVLGLATVGGVGFARRRHQGY